MDGLVPAIVQDADSGEVRMLGYMNRDALEATKASGRVTFWSRSKQALWEKGATSGNGLVFVSLDVDCDGDALLVRARPEGPTCHKGDANCFATGLPPAGFLGTLARIVSQRAAAGNADASYTARLLAKGTRRIAQKVGEEGVETALAATAGDREELIAESADLLYHLTVLLEASGVGLDEVTAELARRHEA
nr:bifunctional phosphoribosyl-AMP cyclohydrolase/phosphoribosyl-ATP diphosphatase HisIE [Sphingomicrobium nitratireducens]